jgi:hypothetical protein
LHGGKFEEKVIFLDGEKFYGEKKPTSSSFPNFFRFFPGFKIFLNVQGRKNPGKSRTSGTNVTITMFCNFRRKKWAFFSKTNALIKLLNNLALLLSQKRHIFADFFGENI